MATPDRVPDGATWSDEYREIITFLLWEPQHLKVRNPEKSQGSRVEQVWKHVQGLEVATNHILNFYLSMVSFAALNESGQWVTQDDYRHVSSLRLREAERAQFKVTQPDLYLQGPERDLAIEIKTKSRSSLEQVHKYLCFQALFSPGRPLSLLFLTPYTDADRILIEKIPLTEVRAHLLELPAPQRHPALADSLPAIIETFELAAMTFAEFGDRVRALRDGETHPVAQRVHAGMHAWLAERGLLNV